MAEEIAREIVSQARSMQDNKSQLAFKFEKSGGGKFLLLSTFEEDGEEVYCITVNDGTGTCSFK